MKPFIRLTTFLLAALPGPGQSAFVELTLETEKESVGQSRRIVPWKTEVTAR